MAQQVINNGESGLNVRNAINGNFTELYNNLLLPIKIPAINSNTNQAIASNVFITMISIARVSGACTLRIGTSPNGEELMSDTVIDQFYQVVTNFYSASASTIYFTFSGSAGVINVRMDVISNYF